MFQLPVPEPVLVEQNVPVKSVRRGEKVYDGRDGFTAVKEVKHGNKYVTVVSHADRVIARLEPDVHVRVIRETAASHRQRSQVEDLNYANKIFREKIAAWKPKSRQTSVLAKLANSEHGLRSHDVGYLLEATARDDFYDRLVHQAKNELEAEPNQDVVAVFDGLKTEVVDRLSWNIRGLSRSTSVIDNVYQDVYNEAAAQFVRDGVHDFRIFQA